MQCTVEKRSKGLNIGLWAFRMQNHRKKSETYFHCGPLCAWECACVFVVTGCGLSDRLGRITGVEITLLFAWATAVICFNELNKSQTVRTTRRKGIKRVIIKKVLWIEKPIDTRQTDLWIYWAWLWTFSPDKIFSFCLSRRSFIFRHPLEVLRYWSLLDSVNPGQAEY